MTFYEQLRTAWSTSKSLLCIGIDPDINRLPKALANHPQAYLAFSKSIIDQVAPYACAFKFQFAHFASQGKEEELFLSIQYVKENHPDKLVILDAKRGDIGSTADHYQKECFERYQADAVTLNPYLGDDSVMPFAQRRDKGCIYLCRTSNTGAGDIQDLVLAGNEEQKLYEYIANEVVTRWNQQNAMLVMGATEPEAIKNIRQKFPEIPLLVPGVGTQGGSVNSVLAAGLTTQGDGVLISTSRAVIYASDPAITAKKLNQEINDQRKLKDHQHG